MSKLRKAAARVLPKRYKNKLRQAVHPAQRQALARLVRHGAPDVGLLSVIVPVYNVAEYVADCLTSIVSQSYYNLEIIVVDDGSTDSSIEIVAGFARHDKRIKVIRLDNGGNGRARNIGIEAASGEYLTFADSDDLVAPDAYALMMTAISNSGSDFVVGSYVRLVGRKLQKTKISSRMHATKRVGVAIDEFPDILDDVFFWNKVFKKAFWDSQVAPIPEGVLYEDQESTARAFVRASRFDVLEEVVYFWRQRNDGSSITQGKRAQKDLDDRMAVAHNVTHLLMTESSRRIVEKWYIRLVGSDLVPYYEQVPYTDDSYWSLLCKGVASLSALMAETVDGNDQLITRLDPHARVMLRLAECGMRDELEQVVVDRMEVGTGFKLELCEGRFYAIPNYRKQLQDLIQSGRVECAPQVVQFESEVVVRGWTQDARIMVSGHAFLRGMSEIPENSEIKLSIRTENGSWTDLVVQPTLDEHLDGRANDAFASHANSAFTALVPMSEGRGATDDHLHFRVQLSIAGHEFESVHSVLAQGQKTIKNAKAAEVSDFFADLDTEEFTIVIDWGHEAPAHQLFLVTKTNRIQPVAVADLGDSTRSYRFALAQQYWGRGVKAPRSGAYTLRYTEEDGTPTSSVGKTLRAEQNLLWKLPLDLQFSHAHVHAWLTNAGRFAVTVSAPLGTLERGKYWQRQLQEVFSGNDTGLQNHLVFESFGGKFCTDSPRALSDELHAQDTDEEIYWSIADYSVTYPAYAKPLIRGSKLWFDKVSTAKSLINNNNFPHYFRKSKGQMYLQTWHGTPIKKIGLDAPTRYLSPAYRALMAREATYWDFLLAQNEFARVVLPRAFGYVGPVIVEGYPRNDLLSSSASVAVRNATRKILGLRENQTAVLYAPTWRDTAKNASGAHQLVSYIDFDEAYVKLGDQTVFLMRGHHNIEHGGSYKRLPNVIDVSKYPEINELILASDVLVTDYSSIMFDYTINKKPILLLVSDLTAYASDTRGLYKMPDELNIGKLVETSTELINNVQESIKLGADSGKWSPYSSLDDGRSSQRVLEVTNLRS